MSVPFAFDLPGDTAVCEEDLSVEELYERNLQDERGSSLYVGLEGHLAGEWTDAATTEHGDLIDLIAHREGCDFRGAISRAKRFLGMDRRPRRPRNGRAEPAQAPPARTAAQKNRNIELARMVFAEARPLAGTQGDLYLRRRGITPPPDPSALRYHPATFLHPERERRLPALVAAVTDRLGTFRGIHRIYLHSIEPRKAPMRRPKLSLGALRGNAMRVGDPDATIIAVGEGLETMLSLRTVMPDLAIAACSGMHIMRAWTPGPSHRHVIIASDRNSEGIAASKGLRDRLEAEHQGIDVQLILPIRGDFNTDLTEHGRAALRQHLVQRIASLAARNHGSG